VEGASKSSGAFICNVTVYHAAEHAFGQGPLWQPDSITAQALAAPVHRLIAPPWARQWETHPDPRFIPWNPLDSRSTRGGSARARPRHPGQSRV